MPILSIHTSNASTVAAKYQEYFRYNLEDFEVLAIRKARSLAISLWMFTPKADAATIRAKVQSLGWQVKRAKKAKLLKLIGRLKRGKNKRGGLKKGYEMTLRDMQQVVIQSRINKIGGVRGGWLQAAREVGGTNSGRLGKGSARIFRTGKVYVIEVANAMPGAVELQSKYHYVEKAFVREIRDMDEYIERKRNERANIFNPSGRRTA